MPRMMSIDLTGLFHACHLNLLGVDDDDAIPAVNVRRIIDPMLPSEDFSDLCSKAAKGFT